jgi:malonyl CoA-acyl carrier protein transacylase
LIPLSAAVEVLWEIDEDAVKNCVATAGFSVGEITSLIFSGALTFEDGVKLVNIRQIAMQQASDLVRFLTKFINVLVPIFEYVCTEFAFIRSEKFFSKYCYKNDT